MEISLIEFLVYALFAYSGMMMLIVSMIKEIPQTRMLAIVRASYMIVPIICAGILASTGVNIDLNTVTTHNLIKSLNTTQAWTEDTTQANVNILQNPVFSMVNWLVMIVEIWFVIQQMLYLFTKPKPKQGVNDENEE